MDNLVNVIFSTWYDQNPFLCLVDLESFWRPPLHFTMLKTFYQIVKEFLQSYEDSILGR